MMEVVALVAGVFSWSLAEYCIHRWAGHDARLRPNLFEVEHTRHHARGNYFAPSWKKAAAAAVVLVIIAPIASFAVGPTMGVSYGVGFSGFYATYELVHRRAHTHPGIGPYGRFIRRHHFWHHFENPRANHGVTSPFWDFVFRTREKPSAIRVPKKLAMVWLLDESGSAVRAEFDGPYQLR
jgi:sterol desaturase/sphingolipid hydroxylase (fatty acid hydroxylase superfamily)